MSGSAAANDVVKIALAVLQAGAVRDARQSMQQSIKALARIALLQIVAALCIFAAFGCAMGALLIYARPLLGGAGALLVGAGVFAVIALAAFGLAWRAKRTRRRSPAVGSEGDTAFSAAASLVKQHTGMALAAAVLAGVFLGAR